LNFGNGFYNDQHFHYGYHIYAAAIVAHFRPEWGRRHWEQVLLLVRSIANPSREDNAFPLFRHKDWYQGNSWASGIPLPPYLNGKNQESSSEAIAAYEAVALYGKVMEEAWRNAMSSKQGIAKEIMQVGQLMAATELRSASKYWHVRQNDPKEKIYPAEYSENVVGILWQSMAQFGTWFGTANYLPYGIQLLPLTPISEDRDELAWMNEMYYPFSESCAEHFQCIESGWGVLQLAVLATVGYPEEAARRVPLLPKESFINAAGNGHSRSNTLWYIATRPVIDTPVPLVESDIRGVDEKRPAPVFKLTDCHAPTTCTDAILDHKADGFTCRERINWLIEEKGKSQWEACAFVAGVEYTQSCGLCDPSNEAENARNKRSSDKNTFFARSRCPPCTEDECYSQFNRCPLFENTFVCTAGENAFGCSWQPWNKEDDCDACCEMTDCQSLKDKEAKKVTKDGNLLDTPICPPCPKSVCYGELNQCPIHTAPYLCLDGSSVGGCASSPWNVSSERAICSECCEITTNC
jgi:endo-1,3(4)-beta-glucanase